MHCSASASNSTSFSPRSPFRWNVMRMVSPSGRGWTRRSLSVKSFSSARLPEVVLLDRELREERLGGLRGFLDVHSSDLLVRRRPAQLQASKRAAPLLGLRSTRRFHAEISGPRLKVALAIGRALGSKSRPVRPPGGVGEGMAMVTEDTVHTMPLEALRGRAGEARRLLAQARGNRALSPSTTGATPRPRRATESWRRPIPPRGPPARRRAAPPPGDAAARRGAARPTADRSGPRPAWRRVTLRGGADRALDSIERAELLEAVAERRGDRSSPRSSVARRRCSAPPASHAESARRAA